MKYLVALRYSGEKEAENAVELSVYVAGSA